MSLKRLDLPPGWLAKSMRKAKERIDRDPDLRARHRRLQGLDRYCRCCGQPIPNPDGSPHGGARP